MRLAWAFSAFVLFATSAKEPLERHQLVQSQTLVSTQTMDVQFDQIITGSLRGSSIVHPVSKGQILRLANAKISAPAHYNQEQLNNKIQELHDS